MSAHSVMTTENPVQQTCTRCYHVGQQLTVQIAAALSKELCHENPLPRAQLDQIAPHRQQLNDDYTAALNCGMMVAHSARDCPFALMHANTRIRENIDVVGQHTLERCTHLTNHILDLKIFAEKNELGKGVLMRRQVLDLLEPAFLQSTIQAVTSKLAIFGDEEQAVRRELAITAKPVRLGYANNMTNRAIGLSGVDWSPSADNDVLSGVLRLLELTTQNCTAIVMCIDLLEVLASVVENFQYRKPSAEERSLKQRASTKGPRGSARKSAGQNRVEHPDSEEIDKQIMLLTSSAECFEDAVGNPEIPMGYAELEAGGSVGNAEVLYQTDPYPQQDASLSMSRFGDVEHIFASDGYAENCVPASGRVHEKRRQLTRTFSQQACYVIPEGKVQQKFGFLPQCAALEPGRALCNLLPEGLPGRWGLGALVNITTQTLGAMIANLTEEQTAFANLRNGMLILRARAIVCAAQEQPVTLSNSQRRDLIIHGQRPVEK